MAAWERMKAGARKMRRARARRVCFLFVDFDGVLNSLAYVHAHRGARPSRILERVWAAKLDPMAIARLNRIVEATGAGVVICSSWRHYAPLGALRRLLRARGFVGRVVGVTPAIRGAKRGAECVAWLSTHRREAWAFAALDDDCDYEPMMDRLVWTSSPSYRRDGLEDRHVDVAIALLQKSARKTVVRWRARADKLTRNTLPIRPPSRLLSLTEARAHVDRMYEAHDYSNIVQIKAKYAR